MSRYLTVIGLILIVSMSSFVQSKKTKVISRGEKLITALINSETLPGNSPLFNEITMFIIGGFWASLYAAGLLILKGIKWIF